MSELNLRQVAESWIKIYLSSENSPAYEENFWAYSQLCDLCDDEPEKCFAVVELIRLLGGDDDVILSNLAAGPYEDLLSKHGEMFIDRIEKIANSDAQLKKLLGAVWQNTIPDSVWKRIRSIASPSW